MKHLKRRGHRWFQVTAVFLNFCAAIGCGGHELTVGEASPELDVDHCFGKGVTCNSSVKPIKGTLPNAKSCPNTNAGELEIDPKFELNFDDICPAAPLTVTADGSIWVLEDECVAFSAGPYTSRESVKPGSPLHLSHYSATGKRLGRSPALERQFGGFLRSGLNVDVEGNAIVTLNEMAYTSDQCQPKVATSVFRFSQDLRFIGTPLVLRGLDDAFAVSGKSQLVTIAGTSKPSPAWTAGNGGYQLGTDGTPTDACPNLVDAPSKETDSGPRMTQHGVLLRLKENSLVFVQGNATHSEGNPVSMVTGMIVGDGESAFVLWRNELSGVSSVSRFNKHGNLMWELELPKSIEYASLVEGANGGVIVNDTASPMHAIAVSPSGKIDWVYQFENTSGVVMDPTSGRFFTDRETLGTAEKPIEYSLLAISKDGSECKSYRFPSLYFINQVFISSPYVYVQSDAKVRRFLLPAQ
jgi:hypothetical protein